MKKAVEILEKNIDQKDGEYTPKLWEKEEKSRIYVSRNSREQAGYITKTEDVKGQNSGTIGNWSYKANRPGNITTLIEAIEIIKKEEEKEEKKNTVKLYHGTTCGQDLNETGFQKVEASNEDEEVFEQGIWLTTSLKSAAWYAAGTRRNEEGEVWEIELPRNFPGLKLIATEEEATNEIGVGDEWVVDWKHAKGLAPKWIGTGWEIWDRLEEEEEI